MNRRLAYIETDRLLCKSQSYKTVYEWEDILSTELDIPLRYYNRIRQLYHGRFDNNRLTRVYQEFHLKGDLHLLYIMRAGKSQTCRLNSNTIPVLIDFWLKDEDLPAFYDAYRYVPLILVTNMEVYQYLINHKCPIPVEHWPLSFPDKYALKDNVCFEKKYDFCILGRPNPYFLNYLDEYVKRHPSFVYIENSGNVNNRVYRTNKGEIVTDDTSRDAYIQMIRDSRVSCYTTPGLDEAKKDTDCFNQVTPRLFEMLANGCHVIGHYPDNGADVLYYGIHNIVPNVNSYDEFECALDNFIHTPFDYDKTRRFLSCHYTSTRCNMLKGVLGRHNITI